MPGVLRLAVVPNPDTRAHDFAVQIFVNDVEMTTLGAGLGMHPEDLLSPENKLVAGVEPHVVGVARCACGELGCRATHVTITRGDDMVRWDWMVDVPSEQSAVFDAARYDREVARAGADHSWETPGETAWRLIWAQVDRQALAAWGLRLDRGSSSYLDKGRYEVVLRLEPDHQVFLEARWSGDDPAELAAVVCATLARPPVEWSARWYRTTGSPDRGAPDIVGPGWKQWRPY